MRKYYNLSKFLFIVAAVCATLVLTSANLFAQGVTTAAMTGIVTDNQGQPLVGANVMAVHEPTGTRYGASTRDNGQFNMPNMRIGGPYSLTVSYIGYREEKKTDVYLSLGQDARIDFDLVEEAVAGEEVVVTAEIDAVFNAGRTGAATYVNPDEVAQLPSVKRSTRDLIRVDPRSDGNYSFGGKNWLYNNISLDGSYFNNAFGLDDPAPGGQTSAEPVPFDAVEQVQVSVAPFDVREGGFTGAGINTVTKSGTNRFKGSVYSFYRNESLIGNKVMGEDVIANPDLAFNQSGFTLGGPIIPNKLFFFINGELERRDDPGTNFVADRDGNVTFGESRVEAATMDLISRRMMEVYNYDTGPYEGFIHETDNEKFLAKLDWNINENHNATLRYLFLDAGRDIPPHPFVLSAFQSGRGPNETSLPFQNSGYQINNEINSFALEVNSRGSNFANRFFANYNRNRDFRVPFSEPFPTIEIAEDGVTYTTVGHEPFSIHNILDTDIWQFTNNFSYYLKNHVLTAGITFEHYGFFNSFNIFRHGLFMLSYFLDFEGDGIPNGSTFPTLAEFLAETDPDSAINFRGMIGSGPFKGENIDVGQLSVYAQDEFLVSPNFSLTYGLRVDFPMYFTEPVDNPYSRGLTLLDENDNPETVDQSELAGVNPLFSPRVGFNWDVTGDRTTQLRGGTGIFTGRVPFVWIGNVISNPGDNPNLYDPAGDGIPLDEVPESHKTSDDAILQQSYDLNAMDPDLKWPQVWTTNLAVDHKLPWELQGTLEILYSKDVNSIFYRNADLVKPVSVIAGSDGRPYFGGVGNNELNSYYPGSAEGVYVIDNTTDGYNFNVTTQLRKRFNIGLNTSLSYTFLQAKSQLKSTEIASVLFQENPVQGDPNKPNLSYSEFGNRHRIVGTATYSKNWTPNLTTHFGLFFEVAEGNRFAGAGGNRYSFTYAGDVNGDGFSNDLIYIPRNQGEINFSETDPDGNFFKTAAQQWSEFNAFIGQDDYLSNHRGEIAERFGAVNPWFSNIDLRILQDVSFDIGRRKHTFHFSLDILNVANLINSDWGVRKVANVAATVPLTLVRMEDDTDGNKVPYFNFTGPAKTYIDDPSLLSRWRIQLGIRYFFN
jgi:hypothetical protein